MKESRVIIYGCGGHARSIVNVLYEIDESMEILLVDENAVCGETILGCEAIKAYKLKKGDAYIIGIGDNDKRKSLYNMLTEARIGHCISVISIYSCVGMEAKIGKGSFVASNTYIGPQVTIGYNTIINTGSIIEHEVIIGNNTHIAPRSIVCGRTRIGSNVFCGAGSTIIDKIHVCDNVIIGAGAVVKEDITEPGTYVGVPARKIR